MIPRHRLRGRRRFAAVRTAGSRGSAAGVRALVRANGQDDARVGLAVVGLRSAVVRNRLRRRLREAVRPLLATLRGHDVVLVAGADAAPLRFTALHGAVTTAVERALRRSRSAPGVATADNGPVNAERTPG